MLLCEVQEGVVADMSKKFIPKKVRHWLKQKVHNGAYIKIIALQQQMVAHNGYKPDFALTKAAEVYGINPREMAIVMNGKK